MREYSIFLLQRMSNYRQYILDFQFSFVLKLRSKATQSSKNMEEELRDRFNAFCSFGSSRAVVSVEIDNSKFSKLARETGIIDKKCTSTDVDIIFNKAKKNKTDRKLDFDQFKVALKLLAEVKYPGEDGYLKIVQLVNTSEPKVRKEVGSSGNLKSISLSDVRSESESNTKQSSDSVFDRLTDHTKYTGSHKERFDEDGKGKGLEGRTTGEVHHISQILRK
eukprot:NODE_950_length_2826_cov_0.272094.p2 type:complete len:221 gc:universal NODE_950_length_2826_cov_0.272094:1054-392(-)